MNYRESYQLKYIGDKVVFNPATAVVEVIKELDRMASLASENLNRAMNAHWMKKILQKYMRWKKILIS